MGGEETGALPSSRDLPSDARLQSAPHDLGASLWLSHWGADSAAAWMADQRDLEALQDGLAALAVHFDFERKAD